MRIHSDKRYSPVNIKALQTTLRKVIVLTTLVLIPLTQVLSQVYPSSATTIVTPPYSVYLGDYFAAESDKLKVNLRFNDFNEPSWDVRLRFTLESTDIRIQTRPDFIPSSAITLTPGAPLMLPSAELAEYFNFNNLVFSGITPSQLTQNGRLPENLYSFCFEILDYRSGKPLSVPGCANAWVVLKEPPFIITPIAGAVIPPMTPQNIPFTWQMTNIVSPGDAFSSEYQLTVYEVTDRSVEPLNAINNSKVLKIYSSEWITQTTFLYDLNASLLDVGKRYVFTVQVRDVDGKDLFKNKGLSQVGWFDYGYPENGVIPIRSPANNATAALRQNTMFVWQAPNTLLSGQPFRYEFKLVEIREGQDEIMAMESNPPLKVYSTPEVRSTFDFTYELIEKLVPMKDYAWMVNAYSGEQRIAKSEVYKFEGPPVLDKFIAAGQEVLVKSTENADMSNLSGVALVRMSSNPQEPLLEVPFKNLRFRQTSTQYVLEAGEILVDLNTAPMELNPEIDDNQSAFFYPEKIKINRNDFNLYGPVKWPLPHAVTSGEPAFVKSVPTWFNFFGFKLQGLALLTDENIFDLLDPYEFRIHLATTSDFFISASKFKLRLNGNIILPDKFKGDKPGRISIPYTFKEQLYYFTVTGLDLPNNVNVLDNSNLTLVPRTVILDLSEKQSPQKFMGNEIWKGVYFEKFEMKYPLLAEGSDQFTVDKVIVQDFLLEVSSQTKAWATGKGLTCVFTTPFLTTEVGKFNTFPSKLKEIVFSRVDGSVSNSYLRGSIKIPVVDITRDFPYTIPLADNGFQTGYLDQSLEERKFIFNPYGGENKVEITIKRAVFTDKERLDMTVDVNIPYVNALMTGVNDFRTYGDYFIGFGKRNGAVHLDHHVEGTYDGFSMFIDQIGASFVNGNYAFSYSATMPLGEEVSGKEGPPRVTIHSVEKGTGELGNSTATASVASDLPPPQEVSAINNILKFDSAFISIESSVADLSGYLKVTKDDPKWGTSLQGGIYGKIKIPSEIETGANLVLGDRDNLKYWYFDAWFIDHQGMGVSVFNMFNIVAFEGKVYRHMELDMSQPPSGNKPNVIINPEVQFGAGLYLQLIDKAGGKQFMTDIAAEVLVKDQGFIISMEGDISLLNDEGRSTAVSGQIRKEALKKAAAEAAKAAVAALGDISIDIPIGGGNILGVKASATGGGLSYSSGDMRVGFEGYVGDTPNGKVSVVSGSKEITVSGNADAYGSLLLKDGSNQLGIDIEGPNGGKLNLTYDAFQIQTAFNKQEGSGSVLFKYDDKIIDVGGNKTDGNGHLGLQYGEKKRMYLELDRAGKGAFEFQYDDNLVAIQGDRQTESGSLKVEVGGHKVAVDANKQEGTGRLLVETSGKVFSINANRNGSGSLRLIDGNNLFAVAADKNAGTASLELKYADDKRMFIAGDKVGKGELEFEYGQKAFRIAADKTIGMGELRLKDGDDKYFNVYVNGSENRGNLGFRYGLDSISALIDNDTSALAFVIQNKLMAVGLHRAGKGGLTLQDGDKLLALTADKTQGSGSLRLEDGASKKIFVSANKTQGTGQLDLAYDNTQIKAGISPDRGSVAFAINNTAFSVSAGRGKEGTIGFRHGNHSLVVDITNATKTFNISDGTRTLSIDTDRNLRYKDANRDLSFKVPEMPSGGTGGVSPPSLSSLKNIDIMDGVKKIPMALDAMGTGSYSTNINGVTILISVSPTSRTIAFKQGGTSFEIGMDGQNYGKMFLTLSGTTYSVVQNNSNTVTLADGTRTLSFSGEKTLFYQEGTSKSIAINPEGLTLRYDNRNLAFGQDKYISYSDRSRSFDLGADGLSVTEGTKSVSLTADKQLILRDGTTRSVSISASQLTLQNEGMEIQLGSDKSLRYSDPERSFSLNTQGVEIIQGNRSMAILNTDAGIGLQLKDGTRSLAFSQNQVVLTDGNNNFTLGGEQYMALHFEGKDIAVGDGFISYLEGDRKISFGGENFVELKDGDRLLAITKEKVFLLAEGNKSVSIGADKSFRISDGTRTISLGGESAVSYEDGDNKIDVIASNGTYGFALERPEVKLSLTTLQFKKATLAIETSFATVSLTGDASKNLEASFAKDGRTITLIGGTKGPKLIDSAKPETEKITLPEVGTQAPEMAGPQYIGPKITEGARGRVLGNIRFYYNSIESHLIANASVVSKVSPCLSGALAIEAKGSYWRIDIGTEQNRIRVFPTCQGFGGGGWLGLDANSIDVGVFAGFQAGGSVGFDLGVIDVEVWARIEAELGIKAKAVFQPSFAINEAGVWVRIYCGVGVSWDTFLDSGSFTVASVELSGTLTFYFTSSTRMAGSLYGRVSICGIGAGFDMGFDKTF